MDTHIKGPAVNGYGAVLANRGITAPFGTPAETVLVLKTDGATPATPLFVRITGVQSVALDGTDPVGKIASTDLSGGNAQDELDQADFTDGFGEKVLVITGNRIFNFVYDPTDSTVGDVAFVIGCSGVGQLT